MRSITSDTPAGATGAPLEPLTWQSTWTRRRRWLVRISASSALTGWLLTGITFVPGDEIALYERFGRLQSAPLHAGCHFLLPIPWGRVIRYPRSRVQCELIGASDALDAEIASSAEPSEERVSSVSLAPDHLLCGSTTEVIRLRAQLAYRALDTSAGWRARWLREASPEAHLVRMADQLLARTAATHTLERLLSRDKRQMSQELTVRLRSACETADLGIEVLALEIVEAGPPLEVRPSFLDVTSASIDAERDLQNARKQAAGELLRMSMMSDSLAADAKGEASVRRTAAASWAIMLRALMDSYPRHVDLVRHRLRTERWSEELSQRRVILWDSSLPPTVTLSFDDSTEDRAEETRP